MNGSMNRTHLAERPSRLSLAARWASFSSTSAIWFFLKRLKKPFLAPGVLESTAACELKAAWSLMRHLARDRSRRLEEEL